MVRLSVILWILFALYAMGLWSPIAETLGECARAAIHSSSRSSRWALGTYWRHDMGVPCTVAVARLVYVIKEAMSSWVLAFFFLVYVYS